MRDIKIGLIVGIIGFLLIVLPLFKLMEWADREASKPMKPIVVYVREI